MFMGSYQVIQLLVLCSSRSFMHHKPQRLSKDEISLIYYMPLA